MKNVFGIVRDVLREINPYGWEPRQNSYGQTFHIKTINLPKVHPHYEGSYFREEHIIRAVAYMLPRSLECAGYHSSHLSFTLTEFPQDSDRPHFTPTMTLTTGVEAERDSDIKAALFAGKANPKLDEETRKKYFEDRYGVKPVALNRAVGLQKKLLANSLFYLPFSEDYAFIAPVSHGLYHLNPLEIPNFRKAIEAAINPTMGDGPRIEFREYGGVTGERPRTYGFSETMLDTLGKQLGIKFNAETLKLPAEQRPSPFKPYPPITSAGGAPSGDLGTLGKPPFQMREM